MDKETKKITIQGSEIRIITSENDENDFICLTDIANKFGNLKLIEKWLSIKNTVEFLGIWEQIHNQDFKTPEFGEIKNVAGSNNFIMSVKKWTTLTNAIGIKARAGKYNSGTWANKDIAMHFCSWISPEFQLYLIEEFQRLKKDELERRNQIKEWNDCRWLTKVNYKPMTDAIKDTLIIPYNVSRDDANFIYAKENNMIYEIVFGRKSNGENLRDIATTEQLVIINNLQNSNREMIRDKIPEQKRRMKLLKQKEELEKSFGNRLSKNNQAGLESVLLKKK